MVLLAQATAEDTACPDGGLLCRLVFRLTGNDLAAGGADLIGTALRVVVLLLLAYAGARLARAAIARFARTMERRIEARLRRSEELGTLHVERFRSRRFQRLRAITGVLRGVAGVVIWVIALLAVLDALGVPLQPLLAGAGLAGIVIGFGAQQLVRDVLAGIAMLIEDQYGVGDWVEIDGKIGQVERVGLRATSYRDLDGIVWHALNGYVQRVGNLSQEWSRSLLDIPLALDADVPAAKAIIHKVAAELTQDPIWGQDIIGDPEIWGVQDFGPEGLSIRLVMPTKPMANWDINRQMRERLHHAFDQANIRMQGKLVELGGMQSGYPLLHRDLEGDGEATPARRRRQGLVPTDVGPLDRPPTRRKTTDEVEARERYDDEHPDHTAELRLERGREPRPD